MTVCIKQGRTELPSLPDLLKFGATRGSEWESFGDLRSAIVGQIRKQALGTCGAFSGPPVHGVVCLAASKKQEIEAEGGGSFVQSGFSPPPP